MELREEDIDIIDKSRFILHNSYIELTLIEHSDTYTNGMCMTVAGGLEIVGI